MTHGRKQARDTADDDEALMDPNPIWAQADDAAIQRDFGRAERLYRQALSLQTGHVPSLIGLSNLKSELGQHRSAHRLALQAWQAKPEHPALLYALAQRLRYFCEYEKLVECLGRPAFASQAPVDVLARGVVMLSSIGAQTEAMALARHAVQREPRNATALYVLGNQQLFLGETALAESCYEASLAADPKLFQNSWMLAGARPQTAESNHVARLHEQLRQARPGGEGETYLYYALHKELHDIGDYEAAWQALDQACSARRALIQYEPAEDVALADAMIGLCTPDFLKAAAGTTRLPSTPIFIVGMHRSGTTLLERMLSGHSDIGDAGETAAFDAAMHWATDHFASGGQPDLESVKRARGADYQAVAERYAESARWLSRGKPWFTEKLPMNFWNVGFIAKALPQARVINLVRDPVATCFSNLRTFFAGVARYSYRQDELAAFYLQYRRVMAHWSQVLPGTVLNVEYQRLVDDPDGTIREVAEFCGFDYQPAQVDVARSGGRIATASAALARSGIVKDRGEIWRHYAHHLQPLIDGLRSVR